MKDENQPRTLSRYSVTYAPVTDENQSRISSSYSLPTTDENLSKISPDYGAYLCTFWQTKINREVYLATLLPTRLWQTKINRNFCLATPLRTTDDNQLRILSGYSATYTSMTDENQSRTFPGYSATYDRRKSIEYLTWLLRLPTHVLTDENR